MRSVVVLHSSQPAPPRGRQAAAAVGSSGGARGGAARPSQRPPLRRHAAAGAGGLYPRMSAGAMRGVALAGDRPRAGPLLLSSRTGEGGGGIPPGGGGWGRQWDNSIRVPANSAAQAPPSPLAPRWCPRACGRRRAAPQGDASNSPNLIKHPSEFGNSSGS
eukprot:gene16172-biopygen9774